MKQFPGLLELVSRVPMKTLAARKTINLPGNKAPESPCISLETDYFPAAIGLETEVLKMQDKEAYSILIGFTFGADTFRASWTRPLFVIQVLDFDIPSLDCASKVGVDFIIIIQVFNH